MDPLAPKIVPATPAVNAPQSAPSGPSAGNAFAKEAGSVSSPQAGNSGAKPASQFSRISESIQNSVKQNLDRSAAFERAIADEVQAKFGSSVSPATVKQAVDSLSQSPHMQKLFDRLYDKATTR